MPRTVELTLPPDRVQEVVREVSGRDDVLSVRLLPGASLEPAGDVVSLEVLDTGLSHVMTLANRVGLGSDPSVSLTTSRPESIVVAGADGRVARDRSTSSWEEMELTLGRESTMTAPKLIVMFVAGLFAGVGLHTGALHILVGAMLVAPGYEPLARVSLGLVNRRGIVRHGLLDVATAYGALAVGAATLAGLAHLFDGSPLSPANSTYFTSEVLVDYWTTIGWTSAVVGFSGGVVGALLVVANRRVLTTGVVIALALVPSLSLTVMELMAGRPGLAGQAALRWLLDVVLVVIGCSLVFVVKARQDGRLISGR